VRARAGRKNEIVIDAMAKSQYGKITKDTKTEKISRKNAKPQRSKTKAELNRREKATEIVIYYSS
jgi:hypothetical protein